MTADDIAALNEQFRIPQYLRVVDRSGHPLVVVTTPDCTAEMAIQGAQVLRWQPAGMADVFWCAALPPPGAGTAIRGGVPVCWPWFGPHPTDASQPQHGLVRTRPWRLVGTSIGGAGVEVAFQIESFGCAVLLTARFGASCTIALHTTNTGPTAISITEALHAYFAVGDVGRIAIDGLDGAHYRDNTAGNRLCVQHGPCTIPAHTDAQFDVAPSIAIIDDPGLGRRITIARDGGLSTVVWNPGASAATFKDLAPGDERRFVCVESGNLGVGIVTLAPGVSHLLSAHYSVAP
jgi:glucose-6-phosphate 1-epimerase